MSDQTGMSDHMLIYMSVLQFFLIFHILILPVQYPPKILES